jgi:hypothetical protein
MKSAIYNISLKLPEKKLNWLKTNAHPFFVNRLSRKTSGYSALSAFCSRVT